MLRETISVMVVDDMSTSRWVIIQALEDIGIKNITHESSAQDALPKLAAQPVHLVISDYNMPGINGLQLLQGLRENQSTSRIGFILITGSPTKELINAGARLGMNNFLKKPFTTQRMKTCIEQVVGKL